MKELPRCGKCGALFQEGQQVKEQAHVLYLTTTEPPRANRKKSGPILIHTNPKDCEALRDG